MTDFDDLFRKITLILAFLFFMSNSSCIHSGVEHEKSFITLVPGHVLLMPCFNIKNLPETLSLLTKLSDSGRPLGRPF